GEVTFTLIWNNRADLDMHVTCPRGDQIYWRARNSCGGELDVDANAVSRQTTTRPVENVFFRSDPPSGRYQVKVVYYAHHSVSRRANVPYTLQVKTPTQTETREGTLRFTGQREQTFVFNLEF
ncbi:MAG: DUF2135 domain-containing protein, partial [Pseudomonadota bacterium]